MKKTMARRSCRILLLWFLLGLSACGTFKSQEGDSAPAAVDKGRQPEEVVEGSRDSLEGFNRLMYRLNDKLDKYLFKPLAQGYRAVTPAPVRKSVANFFSNLREPMVMLNNLLQGKPGQATSDLGRFVVNSTVGIVGLFDVSSKMNLEKHNEDFGQTLAVWGVGDGPYLVLPLLGPSNLRDGAALPVDRAAYPPNHMEERSTRSKLLLVEIIDKRTQLLDASDILEQAAGQDPYIFVREAYRQRRQNLIYDGDPPQPPPDPSLFEEDEPAAKGPSKSNLPAPGR